MIKIEKGVPVPPKMGTRECAYPFADMAPGDSFAVAIDSKKNVAHAIRQSARKWAQRCSPGAKFVMRTEDSGKSVRIWLLTKPASLTPLSVAQLPVAKVHKLADDEDDQPKRRGPKPKIAFDIPSFTDGAKPRKVAGKRY